MKTLRFSTILFVFLTSVAAVAQQPGSVTQNSSPPAPQQTTQTEDISGMYSFLREGEFVQVTVEDGNQVSGFVSRYGDSESDRKTFLDQFFSKASLEGNHLMFTTKPIHGVWFDFDGVVQRGPGKTPRDEGYRVLKGKLTQSSEDSAKKASSKSRQVEFKSFPQDLDVESVKP